MSDSPPSLENGSLLRLHGEVHVLRDDDVDRFSYFLRLNVDLARGQLLQHALGGFCI